jgi:phage-related protein
MKACLERLRSSGNQNAGLRSEHLRGGVIELKISWDKQEFRILYCFAPGQRIYVLHIFQKKTRAVPASEIELAIRRKQEIDFERAIPLTFARH